MTEPATAIVEMKDPEAEAEVETPPQAETEVKSPPTAEVALVV